MARGRKPKAPAALDPKVEASLAKAGWVTVSGGGGGDPWEDGMVVEGELVSINDSSFTNDDGTPARTVTLLVEDGEGASGERVLRCPVGLEARLMRLSKGDPVRIECMGKAATRQGRKAWQFNVHAKPQAGLKPPVAFAPKAGRPKGSRNKRSAK